MMRGEKKLEDERREHDFYRCERAYGAFQRTVSLPSPVDPDKVQATFENGVLKVHMPKRPGEESGIRQIPIGK